MPFSKVRVFITVILSALILSACGSNGGDSLPAAPRDITAPKVEEFFPEKESTNVEVDSYVRIVFSELIDLTSIDLPLSPGDGIELYSGIEDRDSNIQIEEREAILSAEVVPGVGKDLVTGNDIDIDATEIKVRAATGRFALDTGYTVLVHDTVKDLADDPNTTDDEANSLIGTVEITFRTEAGSWQAGGDILDLGFTVQDEPRTPQIISNSNDDVLALWLQRNSSSGIASLFSTRFLPNALVGESSWRHPDESDLSGDLLEQLNSVTDTSVYSPHSVINDAGQAAVVWFQKASAASSYSSVWVSRFDGSWLDAENLTLSHQATNQARDAQIAIDDSGSILVVWREYDGSYFRIRSKFYDARLDNANQPVGWSSVNTVFDAENGDAQLPQVQLLSNGEFILFWPQQINSYAQLYTSTFNRDSGWSAPKRIDKDNNNGDVDEFVFTFDDQRDGHVIWSQFDGATSSLWRARFTGNEWGLPVLMEFDDRGNVSDLSIASSRKGLVFAFWGQDEAGSKVMKSRSFVPESLSDMPENAGWQLAETITNGDFSDPLMMFDYEGNANLLWLSGAGQSKRILSSRWIHRVGWRDTSEGIESLSGGVGSMALGAMTQDGRMLALWSIYDEADENTPYKLGFNVFRDYPD